MSIIKQESQRVAIFIDAQNLYHTARNLYNSNVNFKSILEDTLQNRKLIKAVAYVITTESKEESNFFDALEKAGIETKSKDLQIFYDGNKKADWDVGIAVDAIRLSPKVDAVILVSGDGDFIPLVEYLKFHSGCQVECATFKESASSGLLNVVDDFIDLSENKKRYIIPTSKNFKKYKKKNNQKKEKQKNIQKVKLKKENQKPNLKQRKKPNNKK
ncbi:hypothetical protein CSB11_02585 [Candidatus Campbellbacteria bacterium]|nr:MAG: hypothetical protein CSB11_02585 [Candidatus Campbellbacteria bacterium]